MRKLFYASLAIASLTGAVPALAQGYPGALPQSDVRASTVFGDNHGGWLTALLFGKSEQSKVISSTEERQQLT
jgi:hypothetical protein